MVKSIKKFLFCIFCTGMVLFSISCSVGLGKLVDLEAPEISILEMITVNQDSENVSRTAFDTAIYTKEKVSFYGTASDNVAVTRVFAEIKWIGEDSFTYLGDASLNGSDWAMDIAFDREGACWIKFTAEDESKNFSPKSAKVVSLFVDINAPNGEGWYIDRRVNGIQYNLQTLSTLKEIVANDPELLQPSNIDVAQNGEFYICSSFTDESGIEVVDISIWNESGVKICDSIKNSGSSSYAPKFEINGSDFGLPESGLHYLQVRYTARDIVTAPEANNVVDKEVDMGWFVWWPEKDDPRCYISGSENNALRLYIGDQVNITVFDDDSLYGDVVCELKSSEYESDTSKITYTVTDGEREHNTIVKVPQRPQTMTLNVSAKDKFGKVLEQSFIVYVADESQPTLISTSPENNQIPSVSGNDAKIKFEGITLDKIGCTYLEFVWASDSITDKKEKAEAWLDEVSQNHSLYAPDTESVKLTVGTGDYEGMKLWSAKLNPENSDASAFIKHSYSFDLSLMNDFGNEKTKDKSFFIRLTRKDGKYIESELKLASDNIKPEIIPLSPAGNMSIIDQDSDLEIKFKGEKTNGLAMNPESYKIWFVDKDGNETLVPGTLNSGVYTSETITSATLASYVSNNITPKYKYYVEDLLGNKNEAVLQFMISSLPSIESVNSSASAQNKAGDEIFINVSFSKTINCTRDTKLKLTNIKNEKTNLSENDIVYADYSSGSGTTTLVFKYTVKDGDVTDELRVKNDSGVGPLYGIDSSAAHFETLSYEKNLQGNRSGNPISFDGISPVVETIEITTDDSESNIVNNVAYLKEGRNITAKVHVSEAVTVQGAPQFRLYSGTENVLLDWQSVSPDGKILTFKKTVSSGDVNGRLSYDKNDCVNDIDVCKDGYGNSLVSKLTGSVQSAVVIDTSRPTKPVIIISSVPYSSDSGKYANKVEFTITADSDVKTEYSENGGTTWKSYTAGNTVTITSDSAIVARSTDYAGNVSDYSDQIDVEVNSTFPSYTVECTNSDGNYKLGSTLEFKVIFESPVFVPAVCSAYIKLSGKNTTDKISANAKAVFVSSSRSAGETEATELYFKYDVSVGDDFVLKVNEGDVYLTGIKDLYGIEQGTKTLASPYVRENLHCDTVAPVVSAMVPGLKEGSSVVTINGLNAYDNAKQITLTFSEPVKVVSGKIYLRQTEGWAIPPVLTADEFNLVLDAVKSADIDTTKTYGLTGSQVLYLDGMEDWESLYGNLRGAPNEIYHGTGQYAGPYKKMTYGVTDALDPDLSIKYVLDFDVDIWDSSVSKKTKFGKTFEEGKYPNVNYAKTNDANSNKSRVGQVVVKTPENEITTDSIRYVLEQAHFHERYMDVNSSYVTVNSENEKEVTLNFPEGVLGDSELPLGREWELVIEKGAFMDEAGNYFGAENNGTLNKETESMVHVKEGSGTNKKDTFLSAGIASPVIRVDRYSYGIGIYQPTAMATPGNYTMELIVPVGQNANSTYAIGTTLPTGKVRVRIDCETKNATIRYNKKIETKNKNGRNANNVVTTLALNSYKPAEPDGDSTKASQRVFLLEDPGYGTANNFTPKAFRELIFADAVYNGTTVVSEVSREGIFQTVVNIDNPSYSDGGSHDAGAGMQDVSIYGTTGSSGEPTIVPFPLRDQQNGSAFLRRMYQSVDQYYWISTEVFVDSTFDMYSFGKQRWNSGDYNPGELLNDWGRSPRTMKWGDFTSETGMDTWIGKPNN